MTLTTLKFLVPFMLSFVGISLVFFFIVLALVVTKWRQAKRRKVTSRTMLKIQSLMIFLNIIMFVISFSFYWFDWSVVDSFWCHVMTRVSPAVYVFSNGTVYWFLLVRIEIAWPQISSLPSARLYSIARKALFLLTCTVPLFSVGVFIFFRGEIIDVDPYGKGQLVCTFVVPPWISALFAICDSSLSFGYTFFFFYSLEEVNKQLLGTSSDKNQLNPFRKIARTNLRRCAIAVSSTFVNLTYISVTEFLIDDEKPLTKSFRIGGAFITGIDALINTCVLLAFNVHVWAPSRFVRRNRRVHDASSTPSVHKSTK